MISMRGLKKVLYVVINDFRGNLYLNLHMMDIPLLTLEIALSIFCSKLSFSLITKARCLDKALFQLGYC